MMMEYFSLIIMKTKDNKTLYLGEKGNGYGWSYNYDEAIWFETDEQAKAFAKGYFKKFNDWSIESILYNINTLRREK